MSDRGAGGSRYLYAPFGAASARIEANERVQAEQRRRRNALGTRPQPGSS